MDKRHKQYVSPGKAEKYNNFESCVLMFCSCQFPVSQFHIQTSLLGH